MLAERRRTPPFLKFGAGKLRALPRASDAFLACVLWRRRWGLCSRRQRELSCAPLHGARLLALAGRPRASFPHCQFLYWLFARSLVRLFRSSPFSRSFLCSAALHASVVVETRAMSLDEGDQERQAKAIRCSYARRRPGRTRHPLCTRLPAASYDTVGCAAPGHSFVSFPACRGFV